MCADADGQAGMQQLTRQFWTLAEPMDDDRPLSPGIGLGAKFRKDRMHVGYHLGPESDTMHHHGLVQLTSYA